MPLSLPIVPVILFCFASSLVLLANLVFYTILGEVNGKRGPQDQISMFFVDARFFEVLKLHRKYFPDSKKTLWVYTTSILGFVLGFAAFILWH